MNNINNSSWAIKINTQLSRSPDLVVDGIPISRNKSDL